MGHSAQSVVRPDTPDHGLTWLAAHWRELPHEVQLTILTVARRVL